jgi:hypothetical protein
MCQKGLTSSTAILAIEARMTPAKCWRNTWMLSPTVTGSVKFVKDTLSEACVEEV